jgi:20S proteasome alpha/beta subunit
MTICIGALCSNKAGEANKAIVVASDRMVTLGHLTEFEHEAPKIAPVRDKVVALMAGDAFRASQLIREIVACTPPEAPQVSAVAKAAATKYTELRLRQIDIDIFQPRGLSRVQFYGGQIGALTQQLQNLGFQIDQQVTTFNFNVELLIAGVDDSGAQLFAVGNPGGNQTNLQQIGYHAIGSGQLHAMQSLIGFGHIGSKTIEETLFAVYVAKRRAEVAPGVGTETDLEIITTDGIEKIKKPILEKLNEFYLQFQKPASVEIIDNVKNLIYPVPKGN